MFTDSAKKPAKRTYQNHVEAAFFAASAFLLSNKKTLFKKVALCHANKKPFLASADKDN